MGCWMSSSSRWLGPCVLVFRHIKPSILSTLLVFAGNDVRIFRFSLETKLVRPQISDSKFMTLRPRKPAGVHLPPQGRESCGTQRAFMEF